MRGEAFIAMADRHVLDNQTSMVAGCLAQSLAGADDFCFVSAYLRYPRLCSPGGPSGDRGRFLLGDPGSVEEMDPGEKEPKAFEFTEGVGGGDQPNLDIKSWPARIGTR